MKKPIKRGIKIKWSYVEKLIEWNCQVKDFVLLKNGIELTDYPDEIEIIEERK